jgi:Nuclease-related domain
MAYRKSCGRPAKFEEDAFNELCRLFGPEWVLLTNIPGRIYSGNEIDACLVGLRGVIIFELKHLLGEISCPRTGPWLKSGIPEPDDENTPVEQADLCAKKLKSRLRDQNDAILSAAYINSAVLLTHNNCVLGHVDSTINNVALLREAPLLVETLVGGRKGLAPDTCIKLYTFITAEQPPPQIIEAWSSNSVYRTAPTSISAPEPWPKDSGYDPFNYDSSVPSPQPRFPPSPPSKATPKHATGLETEMSLLLSRGDESHPRYHSIDPDEEAAIRRSWESSAPRRRHSTGSRIPWKSLTFLTVLLLLGWGITTMVRAVGNWWAGLPSFQQVVSKIPTPTWNDTRPQTQSPVTKPLPTIAERMQPLQIPEPPRAVPQPPPIPQPALALPPPPVAQLECPPGTLYDAYTSQCTYPQPNDATAGPPLSIVPECPPGSTYSEQSGTCVIVEASNDCPSDTYRREGSQRCISKRKYAFFRYEQQQTLLAGTFVQAPPVEETYAVNVLGGSIRVYYLEDPASARNVVRSGRAQHIYNYAILSCVLCPATFVTERVR